MRTLPETEHEKALTHDRNVNNSISEEVVVQAGKVSSATRDELDRGLGLDGDSILALNNIQNVLLLLLEVVALRAQVLDDLRRTSIACCGRDVVQRRVRSQQGRVRRSQELLIRSLKSHLVI